MGLALSNAERYQQVQSLVDLLEVEQKRLENLVERLPVGVLLLDEDHTLLVANTMGGEILGLLGAGGVGQQLSTLGSYDLKDLIAQHASPLPVTITSDGLTQRVFEARVRPLGIEQSQWVITVREVTEEREIQVRIQMQNQLAYCRTDSLRVLRMILTILWQRSWFMLICCRKIWHYLPQAGKGWRSFKNR